VYVPAGAEVVDDIIMLDVAVPSGGGVKAGGLKEAVTPEGKPEIERDTLELKPPLEPTVIVVLLLVPADKTRVGSWAEILKSLTSMKYPTVFAEIPSPLTAII